MITARDRERWLAARRKGMTGTDIAALLGLNPWRTVLDVYLDKIGQALPRPQTQAMWWGNYLEKGMARLYAELQGIPANSLLRGAAIARAFPKNRVMVFGSGPDAQVLVRHQVHPFLLATMDGLVPTQEKGLELKTSGIFGADEWGEQGTDQVPLHYLTQCAHYMAVADYPRWDIAAIIGVGAKISGNLALYQVERNRALESEIIATATRFWNHHVLRKIPPPIDGSSSWQAYLAKKYAHSTGRVLSATRQVINLALQYKQTQIKRQQAEAEEMRVRNQLAAIIQSADKTQGVFGTIGWVRPGVKGVTDWEALARSLQPAENQIKKFTKTSQDKPYVRAWWNREWLKDGQ